MTSAPPPGLVYIRDTSAGPGIASRLGITSSTYRKWRMRGEGPETFRIGRRIVARIGAIDAWIDEQEQRARAPRWEARPPEPRGGARRKS